MIEFRASQESRHILDSYGIPDECLASCSPNINYDGTVNVTDLLQLLAAWRACP